jgi:hypothetical protein
MLQRITLFYVYSPYFLTTNFSRFPFNFNLPSTTRSHTYRENFYFVDWFHGCALHSDRSTAGCETHKNFANESICLLADNVQNKVVTIHRSQGGIENAVPPSFAINCFIKKHRYNNLTCIYSTLDTNFHWMSRTSFVKCGFCELQ